MLQIFRRGAELRALQVLAGAAALTWGLLLLLQFIPWYTPIVLSKNEVTQQQLANLPGSLSVSASADTKLAPVGQREFILHIPEIFLSHQVQENVDPANQAEYGPVLEHSIAHGKYTRLPEEATLDGNVYLFAHRNGSKNGRSFGYFHNLDKLSVGSLAHVDYDGKRYTYSLTKQFILQPTDTWVYTSASMTPQLTLQTCENGESQRLISQFKLISVSLIGV